MENQEVVSVKNTIRFTAPKGYRTIVHILEDGTIEVSFEPVV